MLAVRGIYTGKEIQLLEHIRMRPNIQVIVTFLEDDSAEAQPRIPGSAKGLISIADDFEAPLDDAIVETFYQ